MKRHCDEKKGKEEGRKGNVIKFDRIDFVIGDFSKGCFGVVMVLE